MGLRITERALADSMSHAEDVYPEECCGLLAARGGHVVGAIRVVNSHAGPKEDRYYIDPLVLGEEDRALASRGLGVAGIYHSHPDSPAAPSRFDLDRSFPWYLYVIISVVNGRAVVARAWKTGEGGDAPEEMEILVEAP